MKRIFLSAAVALVTLGAIANAPVNETKASYKVRQNFQQEFGNPGNVTWSAAKDDMIKASFELDGQTVNAFYKQDGEYIGTSIDMTKDQLPLKARIALDREVKGAPITELFELEAKGEVAYYARVISGGDQKVYKVSTYGSIREVSKEIFR